MRWCSSLLSFSTFGIADNRMLPVLLPVLTLALTALVGCSRPAADPRDRDGVIRVVADVRGIT